MEQKQVYIIDTCALRKPNALEILRPLVEAGHVVAVPRLVAQELETQVRVLAKQPEAQGSSEPATALNVIKTLPLHILGDTGLQGQADREIFCYCAENNNDRTWLVTQDYNLARDVVSFCPKLHVCWIGARALLPFLPMQYSKFAQKYAAIYMTSAALNDFAGHPFAREIAACLADSGGQLVVSEHGMAQLEPDAESLFRELEQRGEIVALRPLGPAAPDAESRALQARLLVGSPCGRVLGVVGAAETLDEWKKVLEGTLASIKHQGADLAVFRDGCIEICPEPQGMPAPPSSAPGAVQPSGPVYPHCKQVEKALAAANMPQALEHIEMGLQEALPEFSFRAANVLMDRMDRTRLVFRKEMLGWYVKQVLQGVAAGEDEALFQQCFCVKPGMRVLERLIGKTANRAELKKVAAAMESWCATAQTDERRNAVGALLQQVQQRME